MYGDTVILRVGITVSERPEEGGFDAPVDVDVTHRALLAWPGPQVGGAPGLRVDVPGAVGEVALIEEPWDTPVRRVAGLHVGIDAGLVLRPVALGADVDGIDPAAPLHRTLDAARRWSGSGVVVAMDLDLGDSSVAALVTIAMVAGVRVLVLPAGSDPDALREVRRAADVTEALLVERAG